MKLHYTAALTLTGWIIITPPHPNSVQQWETYSSRAPWSQWDIFKTFTSDEQRECMAEAKQIRNDATNDLGAYGTAHLESLVLQQTRCVAADDPRLQDEP